MHVTFALTVLGLLVFKSQNFRGSDSSGHARFEKVWRVMSGQFMGTCTLYLKSCL